MIPSYTDVLVLWKQYNLPSQKQLHCKLVSHLALYFSSEFINYNILINSKLLQSGALLHDIDKNILKKEGEQHPDTAVRILYELGMNEVAKLVKTHPLHAILDPHICPKTWEEKLLFLADKMVKYDIISVDKRFSLWRDEQLPRNEQEVLDKAYPKVKSLEKEILTIINKTSDEVIILSRNSILKSEGDVL